MARNFLLLEMNVKCFCIIAFLLIPISIYGIKKVQENEMISDKQSFQLSVLIGGFLIISTFSILACSYELSKNEPPSSNDGNDNTPSNTFERSLKKDTKEVSNITVSQIWKMFVAILNHGIYIINEIKKFIFNCWCLLKNVTSWILSFNIFNLFEKKNKIYS